VSRPRLDLGAGHLTVEDDEDLSDDELAVLREQQDALRAVVEIFGAVEVVGIEPAPQWPPAGGFVPAWRRIAKGRFDVIPSETTHTDPYADQAPTVPCPLCATSIWHRAGGGWACATCHPPTGVPLNDGWDTVCGHCGGKGRCNPELERLRQESQRGKLEQSLKRTKDPKRRAVLETALAQRAVPSLPARQSQKVRRWKPPKISTSRMP
jgi:hypothetical protein